jgi:hypothetical protein
LHIGHCNFDSYCLKQSTHWERQKRKWVHRTKNKKKATPPQGPPSLKSVSMRILRLHDAISSGRADHWPVQSSIFAPHVRLTIPIEFDSAWASWTKWKIFMGRRPKPKTKTQNQLEELSEENRRLREIVAYLSEVVLTRITETTEPAERSG